MTELGLTEIGRRTVLGAGLGLAGAALATPYIARAASRTIAVWWNQGFYAAEDAAFQNVVRDWEKASGNKAEVVMLPAPPLDERIISALTSQVVPDVIYSDDGPAQIIPQNAWRGRLVDVSDVIATQKQEYLPSALQSAQFYNNVEKRRSFYGVPFKTAVLLVHVWRPLVEKAGYKMSDIPQTWDAFCKFFEPVQDKLRAKGMRRVYGLGFQLDTSGNDPNNTFDAFLLAHGGLGIVTADGRLHADDPKVRQAAIASLTLLTTAYKKGYVPPSALNWTDASDNIAFHAQELVMDFDATISTEVAVKDNKKWYYEDIVTYQLPRDNAGKPVPAQLGAELAFIPKGAHNVAAAKEFLTYLIQPKVVGGYLKQAQGRWTPVMPSIIHDDPYWLDPKDPHVPTQVREVLGPTVPPFYVFNPAYAVVNAEHVWSVAEADIILRGMTPEQAAGKAFDRIKQIFTRYAVVQG